MSIIIFPAAGAALGAAYFALLLWTVSLHASQATALRIVPLYCLRFGMAVLGFWIIAQEGALPLLLALAGFLIARHAMLWRMRPSG